MEKVFVYGTLLKGEHNDHWAGNAKRKSAIIQGELWDTHFGFPNIVLKGTAKVSGEVITTDHTGLKHMDVLEGYPMLYTRVRETVSYPDGSKEFAWVYTMTDNVNMKGFTRIQSGDWREYNKQLREVEV